MEQLRCPYLPSMLEAHHVHRCVCGTMVNCLSLEFCGAGIAAGALCSSCLLARVPL